MNQIPNIEEWKKIARERLAPNITYIDPKFKEVASWAEELLNAFWVEQQKDLDAFIDTLHQQLQNAREELAAEVRLLVAKYYKTDEFDAVGFLNDLQAELDQDNK